MRGGCKLEVTQGHFLLEHMNYCVFDFLVISQLEQICKWGSKYVHLMTVDIWVVLVPTTTHISSFINVAHTELWILDFLLLGNQNRYANEVLNMRIQWQQTTCVVLVPITTNIPSYINVAHTELWIFDFFFVISQSEQICKWSIKYAHLVTTDHMGSTCAHHYPHTKFHQCSPYRTLDIWLFLLLANQNRYANEVFNMCIWWQQITWLVLVPITTHIPSFINVGHMERWIFWLFCY